MNNQKGFSLISVMITMGIMTIITLGMMTQMRVQMLQQTTADVKAAVTALGQSVSSTAIDTTSCTLAITKTPQAYGQNVRFDLPDGHNISAGAKQVDYANVSVTSFTYDGAAQVAALKDGTKVYFGTLNLAMKSNREMIGPANFAPRTLGSIYVTVKPDGNVLSCGALIPPQVAQAQAEAAADQAAKDAADKALQDARNKSNCLLSGGSYDNGSCSYRAPASDDHGNKNDGKDGAPCDGNAGKGNDR